MSSPTGIGCCCDSCPYKAGDFEVSLYRKFVHGSIYIESLASYLTLSKDFVYLCKDNRYADAVEVYSNTAWEIL